MESVLIRWRGGCLFGRERTGKPVVVHDLQWGNAHRDQIAQLSPHGDVENRDDPNFPYDSPPDDVAGWQQSGRFRMTCQ